MNRATGFSTSVGIGIAGFLLLAEALNPQQGLLVGLSEMPAWQLALCAGVALACFATSEWRQRWGASSREEEDRFRSAGSDHGMGGVSSLDDD